MSNKKKLSTILIFIQLLGVLPMLGSAQSVRGQTRRRPRPRPIVSNDMTKGLQIRLSEGAESAAARQPLPLTAAARLSDQEAQNVLKRLEPIKQGADDEKDFQIRDRSLPAPRTGKTITSAFPPPETAPPPDSVASGPLEVLRYSPEGDVPLAPQLSVTFSHPMVAVTSHADAVAANLPVRLTPQPDGRWRWIGTKTLLFEPTGRFPMATDYRIEVPAATKSATGATLASAKRWSFKTPAPTVKQSYPTGGPFKRDPLIFVEFDQLIDPAAVLKSIRVRAANANTEWRTRLATSEEIQADRAVSQMAAAAEKGRWLAFRVVDSKNPDSVGQLPADSSVSVTIGPGTPSAEGPLKTTAPEIFSFKTYGPLRVVRHECGYNFSCSPFDPWSVQFTNPLDAGAFDQSQIKVEPEIAGMKTAIYGNTLSISGIKKGRTTYRLTLNSAIRDEFGQSLGENVSLVFNVKSAPAALASSGDHFVVLDPSAPPRFSVFSINHASLKARIYRVGPENWNQFLTFMRSNDQNTERIPPGRLVSSNTIAVAAQPDEMAETRIDLAPALEGGFGHVFIIVEPTVQPQNRYERRQVMAWAQVTAIGLDAFVDGSELIGWATSLKDGKPIDGVQMTIAAAQSAGLRQGTGGVTRADGLAHIALPANAPAGQNILVARKGNDVAILPENEYWWNERGGWFRREAVDSLRWYVFDDRKMYRPGEEVHIKGWIRLIGGGKEGDVGPLNGAASSVAYVLNDSRGNEILKGNALLNALGGFDAAFKLPPTMNLGDAHLVLLAAGRDGRGH